MRESANIPMGQPQPAQHKTLVLVLGERSWSNIPSDVTVDELLYDDSWRHSAKMRLHAAKLTLKDATQINQSRPLKKVLLLSCISIAAAIGIQQYSQLPEKNRNKVGMITYVPPTAIATHQAPGIIKTDHQQIESSSTSTAAASINSSLGNNIGTSVAGSTIVDFKTIKKPDETTEVEPPSVVVEKTLKLAVKNEQSVSKVLKPQISPQKPVAQKVVSIPLPLPLPMPKKAETPALLPPFPQNAPQLQQVTSKAPEQEKSLLAVDETKRLEAAPALADSADSKLAQTDKQSVKSGANVIENMKPIVSAKSELPSYTIVTLTKKSVVIRDNKSKAPRQFYVGDALPSGEIVKSVNESSGVVITDSRTLRMQ